MANNKNIAFFDSGVGGLTVYSKLKKLLPKENYLYFGDTANMPYGEKTSDELFTYADKIIRFFISQDTKAVVMACNTTSAVIYDKIKDKYGLKIYPVIQTCAKIFAQLPVNKIGVLATPATVNSNAYKNEINKYNPDIEVIQISCPDWVKIVENNQINTKDSLAKIKNKLNEIMTYNPDKIILGCTHYPFLMDVLTKFVDRDLFLDPSIYFAQYIKNDLDKENMLNNDSGNENFYVSSAPKKFFEASKLFYKLDRIPELKLNIK